MATTAHHTCRPDSAARTCRDIGPELALRRLLRAAGLRYRIDRARMPGLCRVDLVFGAARVPAYDNGCFRRGCPEHGARPRAKAAWWWEKVGRKRARDADIDTRLRAAGRAVVRIWEHVLPQEAVARVSAMLTFRRAIEVAG